MQQRADQHAFCITGHYYTYRQLADRVRSIRAAIRQLQPTGQVVALLVNDHIDTYASILCNPTRGT